MNSDMIISEMSIWGGVLVLLMLALALVVLWLVDRRMLHKLRCVRLHLPRLPRPLLYTTVVSVLAGSFAVAGCMVLTLPCQVFWPSVVTMAVCLWLSVPRGMEAYVNCLRHTGAHRRYLLANGATHVESVVPSARRALRASLLPVLWQRSAVMPVALVLMGCGLLMAHVDILPTVVTVLMVWAGSIAASVLSTVLAMWLSDRFLFDKREQLAETNKVKK